MSELCWDCRFFKARKREPGDVWGRCRHRLRVSKDFPKGVLCVGLHPACYFSEPKGMALIERFLRATGWMEEDLGRISRDLRECGNCKWWHERKDGCGEKHLACWEPHARRMPRPNGGRRLEPLPAGDCMGWLPKERIDGR